MASGHWSETNRPIRPGFYNRFKAAAMARIQMGKRGIVAMPVKANWGPAKEVVRITSEKDLIDNFGSDMDYTAYKLGRLVLLGQPSELLLYRLTDGKEKPATLTLKSGDTDAIKVDTKYPTTRKFKITVAPNILDDNAVDLILHEGSRPLYQFNSLSGTAEEIATLINDNIENNWIVATALLQGEQAVSLDPIVSTGMTGGNDGVEEIAVGDYIEAMSVFEGRKFNGFALDGVSMPELHTSLRGWVERNRLHGKKIRAFIGGSAEDTIEDANNRSRSINYEGIVNVGVGGVLDGVAYTPAETACYIMGLGEGQDMKECLTNEVTIFQDVTTHLTHEQIVDTLLAGTLVLRSEDGAVVIEDDVNTLKRYGQDQNENWGYFRAIRFMDMVDEDTSSTGNRQYVGSIPNVSERTGQLSALTGIKQYFETLEQGQLIEDFIIDIDDELQKNAASDELFWYWDAKYINVIKRMFGTGHIR